MATKKLYVRWTPETLAEEAQKYTTRAAFHRGNQSAYQAAHRLGLLDEVCSHMEGQHATAKSKGWWDGKRTDGELIALMHSELSEALEAMRLGNPPDDHIPEFSGVEAELADVVIRIMDYGEDRGLRIAEAIEAKREYNATRERMHGGKAF